MMKRLAVKNVITNHDLASSHIMMKRLAALVEVSYAVLDPSLTGPQRGETGHGGHDDDVDDDHYDDGHDDHDCHDDDGHNLMMMVMMMMVMMVMIMMIYKKILQR